jgi:hypothetical protein
MFNRSCEDLTGPTVPVLQLLNVDAGLVGGLEAGASYDRASGSGVEDRLNYIFDVYDEAGAPDSGQARCDVRGPRTFVATCPSGVCNSEGICVVRALNDAGLLVPAVLPGASLLP